VVTWPSNHYGGHKPTFQGKNQIDSQLDGEIRVAVDIGGTFTDVQALHVRSGTSHSLKTPTTPHDPAEGLVIGIKGAAQRFGFELSQIRILLHGTTIATNAVLERKLPIGALVTTRGFEDVLEIGRHVRRDIYSSVAEQRALLVPRARRFGIDERMRADGTVERALNVTDVAPLAERLRDSGAEAVAICLIHSYSNAAHEEALANALVAHLPGVSICTSHDVSPELREFERTSTTVINALLMPVVGAYLQRLEVTLHEAGMDPALYLFQSNGGVMHPHRAVQVPVRLLLSGPAGGALAARTVGHTHSEPDLVGIDMGGTSFDVCVVNNGNVREVAQGEIAGLPVRVPMSEIRTISAGGGSIARVDAAGTLQVGPDSVGAVPGPACYGQGGKLASVTDANVVLGRLSVEHFLGGEMDIDVAAARTAITNGVGHGLGVDPEHASAGVLRVAVVQMAAAIRLSLFEKGLDPRRFALVSFGGAGGLHAAEVATELGAQKVIYPVEAATLSAWGMLFSDVVHDYAGTRLWRADEADLESIQDITRGLTERALGQLKSEGFDEANSRITLMADMRYPGQAYEISIAWPTPNADAPGLRQAVERFHTEHEAQFAHCERDTAPQVLTWRVRATGTLPRPGAPAGMQSSAADGDTGSRTVFLDGERHELTVFSRAQLRAAGAQSGPTIVEDSQTTIFIPANWSATTYDDGTVVAEQVT
jgi:N-methylhydantoinase A